MRYEPDEHRAALAKLSETSSRRRLFFALWCMEPLWQWAGDTLVEELKRQLVMIDTILEGRPLSEELRSLRASTPVFIVSG